MRLTFLDRRCCWEVVVGSESITVSVKSSDDLESRKNKITKINKASFTRI